MIEKNSHSGIAVKKMEEALSVFQDGIGLEVISTGEVETQKVRVAFLPVGETRFELLEPTGDAFGRDVVWSHPAYANRSVYARNDKELVCVSLAAK